MRSLNAIQLLDTWEQGTGQAPIRRALMLLAAAYPEEPVESLAALSIGKRDARLLLLREWTFGPQLSSIADCPACRERLEINFQTGDLFVYCDTEDPADDGYRLDSNGYRIRYRLPNSLDLIAVSADHRPGDARQALIERCLLEAAYQETPLPVGSLPEPLIAQVTEGMRKADPQAEIEFNCNCPACGHAWSAPFDILAYFWSEIEAWTQRIFQEVHRLAQAYGWSEREILQMSAWRRSRYLEMIER